MGYYDMPVDPEYAKRQLEEQQRRSAKIAQPAPEPYLPDGSVNPAWRERHPLQQVVILPDVGPRGPDGGPPEVDGRSEAEKSLDPKAMLIRINALEKRVAELESRMARYFGGAGATSGEVYR